MVAILLFLAFAFFAVGQAGATRNSGQSAADAAALAAAQQSRDDFAEEFLSSLLKPGFLDDVFSGQVSFPTGNACGAAARFADVNRADLDLCDAVGGGQWGFRVRVTTQNPVGKTVLPITAGKHADAVATAIIEPRCTFAPNPDASLPTDTGSPSAPPDDGSGAESPPPVSPGELNCRGDENIVIDPSDLENFPDMADLFTVRLADN